MAKKRVLDTPLQISGTGASKLNFSLVDILNELHFIFPVRFQIFRKYLFLFTKDFTDIDIQFCLKFSWNSVKISVANRPTVLVFGKTIILLYIIWSLLLLLIFCYVKDADYSFQPTCLLVGVHLAPRHLVDRWLRLQLMMILLC